MFSGTGMVNPCQSRGGDVLVFYGAFANVVLCRCRGASVARVFAKHYSVALLARKPENFEPLVKEINDAGGHAVGISTDAVDNTSVVSAFEQLKKEFAGKSLAAAVYNVGGRFIRKPFLELTEEEAEAGWSANGYVSPTTVKRDDRCYPPVHRESWLNTDGDT